MKQSNSFDTSLGFAALGVLCGFAFMGIAERVRGDIYNRAFISSTLVLLLIYVIANSLLRRK